MYFQEFSFYSMLKYNNILFFDVMRPPDSIFLHLNIDARISRNYIEKCSISRYNSCAVSTPGNKSMKSLDKRCVSG